jgi:BirA family biotin operon repressor/biotin-[acetyl-CoA-carboxylase] ligase
VALVETYATIGSTNDRAAALGRAGADTPAVVVAEEQTAGRGRRGAAWRSMPGAGIWMSILLPPGEAFPGLPLAVGVACARAIERVAGPGPVVRVKWPNDLEVARRKVGGILCETSPTGLVIGVGLDVAAESVANDAALERTATALETEWGKTLDRNWLADSIVGEILRTLAGPGAFAAVLDELGERDALVGRSVVTETRGHGVAAGIDADGALLLDLDGGGRVRVVSGSVRLARPEGAPSPGPGDLAPPAGSR